MTDKYTEEMLKSGHSLDEVTPLDLAKYKDLVDRLSSETAPIIHGSGLRGLDNLIGGFEPGRLYVLSAPTKNGKTTFAQTLMYNTALAGIGSIFFSYEMGWREVTRKFMAMDNRYGKKDKPTDLPILYAVDPHKEGGGLQMQWMAEAIMRQREIYEGRGKFPINLVVIDHLHFLLPLKDYRQNVSFLIGGIVREIKRMATELNIPIILIAHTGMIKDEAKPTFRNIRDSSFITQEADVVMMMWRKKNETTAKRITDDSVEEEYSNITFLSVELDRVNGVTGKLKLYHNGAMFEEYDGAKHGNEIIKKGAVCTTYPKE